MISRAPRNQLLHQPLNQQSVPGTTFIRELVRDFIQKFSNGRTHWTDPQKTCVSNRCSNLGVRWDLVPFNFLWNKSYTPPKFNSSPLRNGGWKTILSYSGPVWPGNFSGANCETSGAYPFGQCSKPLNTPLHWLVRDSYDNFSHFPYDWVIWLVLPPTSWAKHQIRPKNLVKVKVDKGPLS